MSRNPDFAAYRARRRAKRDQLIADKAAGKGRIHGGGPVGSGIPPRPYTKEELDAAYDAEIAEHDHFGTSGNEDKLFEIVRYKEIGPFKVPVQIVQSDYEGKPFKNLTSANRSAVVAAYADEDAANGYVTEVNQFHEVGHNANV